MSELEQELGGLVRELGFELVTLQRGGGRRRPLLRLRIDREDSGPGRSGVTIDDCARVSRRIRERLEGHPLEPADYVLEVSSPGVERPLVKPGDYGRFAGQKVRIRGYAPLAGRSRQLEGLLLGLDEGPPGTEPSAALEVEGERLKVPLAAIASATLVYAWEDDL